MTVYDFRSENETSLSGGISSSIAGGDFWHGFGIAATVGLVNHMGDQLFGKNIYEEQSGTLDELSKAWQGDGYGIQSTTRWRLQYNIMEVNGEWILDVSAFVWARADGLPSHSGVLNGFLSGELRVVQPLNRNTQVFQRAESVFSYVGSAQVTLPNRGSVKYSFNGHTQWGHGHSNFTGTIPIPIRYVPYLHPVYEVNRRRR